MPYFIAFIIAISSGVINNYYILPLLAGAGATAIPYN